MQVQVVEPGHNQHTVVVLRGQVVVVGRVDCIHTVLVASVGDIAQPVELGMAPEELDP